MSRELCPQFIGVRKVQFEEMYLAVTQILAAAGRTYTRPHTELAFNASSTMKLPINPLAPVIKIDSTSSVTNY